MNASCSTPHFADHAVQRRVPIELNEALTDAVHRVRFSCPDIARRVVPGQFVMVRPAGLQDPLIGRPLAVYDILMSHEGTPSGIDLVYQVGGKGTTHLARMERQQTLDVWGPLGNGFPAASGRPLIMVAGGIGQTPFLLLGKETLGQAVFGEPPRSVQPTGRVFLCYGARTASGLVGLADFEDAGIETKVATDDGTRGYHGLVTDLLEQLLDTLADAPGIACCGPARMMRRVSELAGQRGLACRVSLETPMACGIGICFSCVARVRTTSQDQWDYQRTCVHGPVFEASQIKWED